MLPDDIKWVPWYAMIDGELRQQNLPEGQDPTETGWTKDLDSLGYVEKPDELAALKEEVLQTQAAMAEMFEQLMTLTGGSDA